MSLMFITSEKENFKVCTTGGAKIRSQNDLKASSREKLLAGGQIRTHAQIAILDFLLHSVK